MSDETNTPSAADLEILRSSHAAIKAERDLLARERDALKQDRDAQLGAVNSLTVDKNTLAGKVTEFGQTLATLQKERDEALKKHSEASTALTDITNKTRERDVIDGLRAQFPGADPAVVRGAFLAAVEDKKTERYPEKPADAVAALAELLKPTLSRLTPVAGGGPPQTQQPAPPAKPGFYSIGARIAR